MGCEIILTREYNECIEIINKFSEMGCCYLLVPVIKIVGPKSWKRCDRAIENLSDYDAIVFTSKNGVVKFIKRLERRGLAEVLKGKRIYAVGKKTSSLVEQAGYKSQPLPDAYNAADLSALMIKDKNKINRVLIIKGDLASNELAERLQSEGIKTEEIIVYRNKKVIISERKKEQLKNRLMKSDRIRIVVFFSPSAVKNFFDQLGWVAKLGNIYYAVIGKTTEMALKEYGLSADIIPCQATSENLFESIKAFIKELQ
jgi:uroporphyrinogen-III synthase